MSKDEILEHIFDTLIEADGLDSVKGSKEELEAIRYQADMVLCTLLELGVVEYS
jgi:hypothetical protein